MHIFLLYGGVSSEREVSISTARRVSEALKERGHKVDGLDWQGGAFPADVLLAMHEADAVFLALHGGDGENGQLQTALEGEGIFHYTGSAPLASSLAMNKQAAKERVLSAGVPVASGALWQPGEKVPPMRLPMVAKPISGGSSVGLHIFRAEGELAHFCPEEPLLCERYLPGREYTVGILLGRVLPVVEICPVGGDYDYAHKYTVGGAREICPAEISLAKTAFLQGMALAASDALGLRDVARIDFKEDSEGMPCFLEANSLPGLTATSLLPLAAAQMGISFPDLCLGLAERAARRKPCIQGE